MADELTAFLAMLRGQVERLRDEAQRGLSPTALDDYNAARRRYEATRLDVRGVRCPICDEHGEVVAGWRPASLSTPREAIHATCACCDGEGWVLPAQLQRYMDRHGITHEELEQPRWN